MRLTFKSIHDPGGADQSTWKKEKAKKVAQNSRLWRFVSTIAALCITKSLLKTELLTENTIGILCSTRMELFATRSQIHGESTFGLILRWCIVSQIIDSLQISRHIVVELFYCTEQLRVTSNCSRDSGNIHSDRYKKKLWIAVHFERHTWNYVFVVGRK